MAIRPDEEQEQEFSKSIYQYCVVSKKESPYLTCPGGEMLEFGVQSERGENRAHVFDASHFGRGEVSWRGGKASSEGRLSEGDGGEDRMLGKKYIIRQGNEGRGDRSVSKRAKRFQSGRWRCCLAGAA